ncbi:MULTISPECIES: TadE/TadG family type IV pilus assembly protein [Burkholderia]|uniref:TadE family protein n=1 Tax=Burkholderia aenigmatica TaxID=2015348 RepID=A0A6P2J6B9_9BURK|nr:MULTISPECIES: TadE/TadG family type IV pilus assembly protein [Burkholderia]MBN3838934.1 pilus assembly protein [Burkholderia sp. Ac-20349]MDN7519141.1 TadE/TadG family type IV pilus assembly protein [Burkholderia sp. AU45251]VWB38741.1 TadE family protein [Burkholderia aenigmatica]HDR9487256.1 pilus assembly protein [Burkholderia aenigmatica]HDR9519041.1 pilus assembly protein [Burkholderia aenigmatica]
MARGTQARQPSAWRRQRGVAAVEFAVVFPLFFLIFYAIVTFGMVFIIQQSLTFAASEGARAALNYTSVPCDRLQVNARNAVTQALAGAPWSSNVSFAAQVSTSAPAPTSTPGVTCGTAFVSTSTSAFNVMVTTTYSYAANPLIPWIFLFNAPQLQSSATVQVQPSML